MNTPQETVLRHTGLQPRHVLVAHGFMTSFKSWAKSWKKRSLSRKERNLIRKDNCRRRRMRFGHFAKDLKHAVATLLCCQSQLDVPEVYQRRKPINQRLERPPQTSSDRGRPQQPLELNRAVNFFFQAAWKGSTAHATQITDAFFGQELSSSTNTVEASFNFFSFKLTIQGKVTRSKHLTEKKTVTLEATGMRSMQL